MYVFRIMVANHVIEIKTDYPLSPEQYSDFLSENPPESVINISVHANIIRKQVIQNLPEVRVAKKELVRAPSILQYVADELLDYNVILVHGATIAIENEAYIFMAPSGTGKTTHVLKWLSQCPDAYVVNGDKTFISLENSEPMACGSPWAGKERMYTNTLVPLKAIILMERNYCNNVYRIKISDAFPFLLQQVYRPDDRERMRKVLQLTRQLGQSVSIWHFDFNNFREDCFQTVFGALRS